MSSGENNRPIVIKRIKKAGHAHHGGSWKVAYADFVTAMMAFFLLMWLLGSTSQTEREGIAEYFQNPSATQGQGGLSTSVIDMGGNLDVPRGEGAPRKGPSPPPPLEQPPEAEPAELLEEILEKQAKLNDQATLDELMRRLKDQIENTPSLKDFKDQLLLDITSEGVRIQIVDRENRPMFDLGSSQLKPYTRQILNELAKTITEVPNHISISGHTDATPYGSHRPDYTNWELSADRANAARRTLLQAGMKEAQFGRAVGLSSSVLFYKEDPLAPVNRRISIVVLNRATEQAIGLVGEEGGETTTEATAAEHQATP